MKIAAFNVENLFDRAKAFNEKSEENTKNILRLTADLNILFDKKIYAEADKTAMLKIMKTLGILKSDEGKFVLLRRIRGRIIKRPRLGFGQSIIAKGRDDWIGWLEMKTEPVQEIAIENTGRVIRDVDADILAVVEAEDRIALKKFSSLILSKVNGTPYEQVMLIDGNDRRGIDVGIMTKNGYSIGRIKSHIYDKMENGARLFSRDCPEYMITTPNGHLVWVLPNHFKSKYGGDTPESSARRTAQAKRVAEIYNEIISDDPAANVIVLGDLNDRPNSSALRPLLVETSLKEVSDHPTFDLGEFKQIGTFGLGNTNDKIDYLLVSPNLFDRVTSSGLFRKGVWPGSKPKRWTTYESITKRQHVASDHHVIWAEIDLD